jgi:hypothetical protein
MFSSRKTGSASNNYLLTRSLRFRSSASASLSRTPGSATNRTTWTWSGWIKRGDVSTSEMTFFSAGTDGNNFTAFAWLSNNLFFQNYTSGSQVTATSTAVFRDPSAWYHVVLAIDTTQATASNRAKLYVNGVQQAGFNGSSFSSSQQFWINYTYRHTISARSLSSIDSYTDQYMTEINFVDGSALTPSSFGITDPATGVWQPIRYTGTYGTNGFYLPFTDNSALTTSSNAGLGKDFSGNSNYWTTNNISITSGSTYDSMTDVPTNTNATTANYCVLNPLDKNASSITISNGNLQYATSSTNFGVRGTVAVSSGKWYWEANITTKTNEIIVGIANAAWGLTYVGSTSGSYGYGASGAKYNNAGAVAYGASFTTGDVIGIALDLDAGTLVFYKNNVSQGTAYSSLSGTFFPACSGQTSDTVNINFGQRPFAYTPPTGFVALNTFNLPTPTIGATASTQANKYFDATLYTGTGSSQTISSLNFSPDFVWIKERSADRNHRLQDSVRGANKSLRSNGTQAEATDSADGYVSAFTSNGFTTAAGSNSILDVGESSGTYVAWCWDANGSGSSNTSGSITSTVSANTTSGFSVVTYTGNATIGATIGHGLGVAPSMLIVKQRTGGLESWQVYHSALGATQYLQLNSSGAAASNINRWNNTAPTSTVFTVYNDTINNGNTNTYVAYCFTPIAGYSAFSSYTGNGSTDGPFLFTGFRPKYILIKRTNDVSDWWIWDTARNTINVMDSVLYPNDSAAEYTSSSIFGVDALSNGFKMRTSNSVVNGSSQSYIYAAFAESPFKYANAR